MSEQSVSPSVSFLNDESNLPPPVSHANCPCPKDPDSGRWGVFGAARTLAVWRASALSARKSPQGWPEGLPPKPRGLGLTIEKLFQDVPREPSPRRVSGSEPAGCSLRCGDTLAG